MTAAVVSTDRAEMLADAYPALAMVSRSIAARLPPWLRDELESELLVTMTIAARDWEPGLAPFPIYASSKMRYAAAELARAPATGWSRHQGKKVFRFIEVEGASRVDRRPSAHDRAVFNETLAAIATLPTRLQVVLVSETNTVAEDLLGVSKSRISQLRNQAHDRLATMGVAA